MAPPCQSAVVDRCFSLVLAGTYYFHVKDLGVQLEQSKAQEVKLKNNFEQKAFQAANLEAYRIQMAEVESFLALAGAAAK